jgi:hypothetical protein
MADFITDEENPILVEFELPPGEELVARGRGKRENLKKDSEKAINGAMAAIEHMSNKVNGLRDKIPVEFSQVEVAFGIKMNLETGIILAKAGMESSINVKLTWEREKAE